MNDRFFLDTNVVVYTFDPHAPSKRGRAQQLLSEALERRTGFISTQVIQEFLNVALRKFDPPLRPVDARVYIDGVLEPLCEVFPSMELYRVALRVHGRWGYSFYDSLIIAAAIEGKAEILYSEDLQANQALEGLQIVNPF